ncbi:TetR/AcrR family transcriptional regulator [Actinotalea subterranea]|uniref:TetR/AcrR family transcriptional regulator n=1 Tax=Actinotalea subterranea TaxID=2607497 RepID=UPI0011EF5E13|nr:TetR/AcrR family transcriptional regulator [Actinotalea subterranea]
MNFKRALTDLQRSVDAQVADALADPLLGVPGLSAPTLGRPRDRTRDPVILEAALDVLAETGYEAMTIEMVATRARAGKATLYRRWASKAHLVVDAVASIPTFDAASTQLPDTGSLRGDLLALLEGSGVQGEGRDSRIVAGLCAVFPQEPGLAAVVRERLLAPRVTLVRSVLERARDRGEVPAGRDLDVLALAVPAVVVYRMVFLNEPVTRDDVVALIDGLVLPAAGVEGTA